MTELAGIARELITTSTYMAIGTAGPAGSPWVTPVYYAPDGNSDFYWISSPDARHSRNIATRPEISIVIFDSRVRVGAAEAVYMAATAARVPDEEIERAGAVYNGRLSVTDSRGARHIDLDELRPPGLFRLYHARVTEHSVLIRGGDPRYGRGADSRLTVNPDD